MNQKWKLSLALLLALGLLVAQQPTITVSPSTTIATQGTGTNLHMVMDSGIVTAVTSITNALPAGTNVIGHVIADTGSTTAVTQATGSNLHMVVDSGIITTVSAVTAITNALPAGTNVIGHVITDSSSVVTATLSAETTKVIGTVNQGTSPWIVAGGGTAGSAASGVVTIQGIASMTKLLVTPDSVALPANQSVNVSQWNAHTALEGGANGSIAIGGTVATNVAITANPVNLGAQAVSSENSAVTTARQVQLVADLVGKLIVLPYANPENFTQGTTAAITDTSSTSVIASAGGSLRNYLTDCIVTNSHATVGTFVKILDGSTIIDEGYAAAAGGGFVHTYPTPRRGTAATAINAQPVTTGANVIVSCGGYKGL